MEFTPAEGRRRVAGTDWAALAAELDDVGCAATGPLLTPAECAELAGLYERPELFRTTVDLARHRFGSGAYRYFTHDLPAPVAALRGALYPRLLPLARDWAARLGRGWSAGALRHGVSTVRSGRRRTLGLVFHDAG
ncbi:2OG-Fe(II) oxygenase [Streptomyces murinus]|uniref:2OG-Fe(II) oxygenase n=1 Tax=Streptomyces murinus TaxID=33900 RepID=UPI0036377E54